MSAVAFKWRQKTNIGQMQQGAGKKILLTFSLGL